MIKVFRTNGVLQIAIIVIAVVAIWVWSFIAPPEMADNDACGPLYLLLKMGLGGLPTVSVVVGIALTLAEGYLLNRLLYEKGLVPLNSLMPMLMYVIFMGMGVRSNGLSPALLTNLWILLAMMAMMPKENMIMEERRIFDTGLWCSMAILTWIPSVAVLIPIALGQITYKMYKGREWAVSVLGLLAPVIVVVTTMFMMDRMDVMAGYAVSLVSGVGIRFCGEVLCTVEAAVFVLLGIVLTIGAIGVLNGRTIVQRKHGIVMVSMLIYSAATLFYASLTPIEGGAFAIAMASTGSIYVMDKKKRLWIYDLMVVVLFVMSLIC